MKALSPFLPSLDPLDSAAFFRRPVRGLMALMLHCRPRPKVEDGGIVPGLGWFPVWFRVVDGAVWFRLDKVFFAEWNVRGTIVCPREEK